MNMQLVDSIMGSPDDSLKGYFDTSKIMYIYSTSFISSSDIEIYFDSSRKVVTEIILPKGE